MIEKEVEVRIAIGGVEFVRTGIVSYTKYGTVATIDGIHLHGGNHAVLDLEPGFSWDELNEISEDLGLVDEPD